jgi:hypothetical protein
VQSAHYRNTTPTPNLRADEDSSLNDLRLESDSSRHLGDLRLGTKDLRLGPSDLRLVIKSMVKSLGS